jgi:hypothetical protein
MSAGVSRNSYDTTMEALRARIERVADRISERAQMARDPKQHPDTEGVAVTTIDQNVNGIGEIVTSLHDLMNQLVNVTVDTSMVGDEVKVQLVNAATAQTEITLEAAQAIVDAAHVAEDVAGADFSTMQGGAEGGEPGADRGSAAQLIQARRKAIEGRRKALRDRILAKRREIKGRIEAARTKN